MPNVSIIDARQRPDAVKALIQTATNSAWPDYGLYRQLGPYWHRVLTKPCADLSCAVLLDDQFAAYALANDAYDCIGYFGRPISFTMAPESPEHQEAIAAQLCDHFERLCTEEGRPCLLIKKEEPGDQDGPLAQHVLAGGGTLSKQYRAVVDLALSEEEIRRAVRKSYRSLINWGRKNFETVVHAGERACQDDFDAFRELHAIVSGRVTRPLASWREMFSNVKAGRAELITGRINGRLAAATFVNYSPLLTSYATGVYDRQLFDNPMAHWPVYLSILRAKERGCRVFDLGEINLDSSRSSKEINIAHFKKGFTDAVEVHTIYHLNSLRKTNQRERGTVAQ